ncbi:elongation factor G [Burkholderiaceae bacterium FT117]|uniref:elongation factor G n=1 Tax=Zeimonas sediminis TaxID=2944268 RepID=UPI002342C65F|nr:elongation factor G [Zeimonas sediminis]MCM5570285.1 elongation factor G [Zeimonas sediminis]
MSAHPAEQLRTLAFVGHTGVGKTTLVEALLAGAGAIPSAGSVERGDTVCDYDPLEKSHGHSLQLACAHLERDGVRVHLLDTPGYPDFAGRALAALDAVETVALVVDAQRGVELSTARMGLWAQTRGLCRIVVVNRIDAAGADLPARLEEIRAAFGRECLPLNLPADGGGRVVDCFFAPDGGPTDFDSVEAAHRSLVEQVVEVDDALTERYLSGDPIDANALHDAFERALREAHVVPVLFTSARSGAGVAELLDFIVRLAPSPLEGNPPLFERWPDGDPSRAQALVASRDAGEHVLAHVFKVEVDPYVGRIGVLRVHQGTLRPGASLYVGEARKAVRIGTPFLLQGREQKPLAAAGPGEICALAKLDELAFDAVLHDAPEDSAVHFRPLPIPHAVYGLALRVARRGDEQKLAEILQRLVLEDPSLSVEHDPTTHEAVIRGLGELHVAGALERIRSLHRLEVEAHPPTIPYRETIAAPAEGHHRHKKQSGGAGQFGEVFLRIAPLPRGEGFRFVDEVKGGAIPGPFIAAVEKGVRQALAGGAVAGFPVQDVEVTVYDGKTHPVDGKEIAFVTAGRKAFLDAAARARPVVLEPIVGLELTVPEEAIGAVSGELSARRGQVSGSGTARAGMVTVSGRAPLAELEDFQGRLKAVTGGQGSYTLELIGYEEAPPPVQARLRAAWRPAEE